MGQIDGEREEGEAGFGRKGGREGEREEESRRGKMGRRDGGKEGESSAD